jgi:hypothetical protein
MPAFVTSPRAIEETEDVARLQLAAVDLESG